jgi:hypothetical protein
VHHSNKDPGKNVSFETDPVPCGTVPPQKLAEIQMIKKTPVVISFRKICRSLIVVFDKM